MDGSAGILHEIPGGLVQYDLDRLICRDARPQQVMYHHSDVFRGRIQLAEELRIQIKISVVEPVDDLLPDDVRKHLHVHHVSCAGVRYSRHLDGQLIVVTMVMGKVALSEYLGIGRIIPVRIVKSVCCVESDSRVFVFAFLFAFTFVSA